MKQSECAFRLGACRNVYLLAWGDFDAPPLEERSIDKEFGRSICGPLFFVLYKLFYTYFRNLE